MLSYEKFKELFNQKLPSYMGEEYKDYEVQSQRVIKRGVERDGFIFVSKEEDNCETRCTPTLYYDEIYNSYLVDEDFNRELTEIAFSLERAYEDREVFSECCSIDHMRENIIAELVNSQFVDSYIDNYPHRSFLDITIIYRWVIHMDDNGVYSGMIDNDLMEKANLTEEEMYKIAFAKTKKLLKFKVISLEKVLAKMMRRDGADRETIREAIEAVPEEDRILTITNRLKFRASTALIYNSFLKKIADGLGDNFYVVPTSCNESLVVPAGGHIPPSKLLEMHHSINHSEEIDNDEFLSWNIYYFSREKNALEVFESDY